MHTLLQRSMSTAHGQAATLRPRPCLPSVGRHRYQQQRRRLQVQAAAEPKEKQQERGVPDTAPAPGGTHKLGGSPPPPPDEGRDWPSIKKRSFVLQASELVGGPCSFFLHVAVRVCAL